MGDSCRHVGHGGGDLVDDPDAGGCAMTDNRSTGQKLMDAGATADWITPAYSAARNILQGGKEFTVTRDVYYAIRPQLDDRDIAVWGVQMTWHDDGYYLFTFNVPKEHADEVSQLCGDTPSWGCGGLLALSAAMAMLMLLVAAVTL